MAKAKKKSNSSVRRSSGVPFTVVSASKPVITLEKLFATVIAKAESMTKEERVRSLIDAGILTRSGKRLAKPYRSE